MGQRLKDYLALLKARHWVKNLFLFAAPFFGGTILSPETLSSGVPAVAVFCLAASSGYIINDMRDADIDRLHPRKRLRPLASGRVAPSSAVVIAVALFMTAVVWGYMISPAFALHVFIYLALQSAYSFFLKNIALLDVFAIASGFVIRVLAGGIVFALEISSWLFVTTFMISLVLATGKRLGEMTLLNGDAPEHRVSLNHCPSGFLEQVLLIAAAASLLTYALYTVEQSVDLVKTVPLVTLGLFRYIMLSRMGMGDPTDAMTRDKWLALTVIAWVIVVAYIRYA